MKPKIGQGRQGQVGVGAISSSMAGSHMFPGERKTEFAGSLSMSGDPGLSLSPCHIACGKIGSLLCLTGRQDSV